MLTKRRQEGNTEPVLHGYDKPEKYGLLTKNRKLIDIALASTIVALLFLVLTNKSASWCFNDLDNLKECAQRTPMESHIQKIQQYKTQGLAPLILQEDAQTIPVIDVIFTNLPDGLLETKKTQAELDAFLRGRANLNFGGKRGDGLIVLSGLHEKTLLEEVSKIDFTNTKKMYKKFSLLFAIEADSCEILHQYTSQLPEVIYKTNGVRVEVSAWKDGELLHCNVNDQSAARIARAMG
ncbi:hypothetical protein AKO1_005738 [Acrasis kona]|uniref:Uncharacterized protein n=1 Tax=Acrasis kona TaxID=1008807 RepID=A0AAW2YJK1_9EUKA